MVHRAPAVNKIGRITTAGVIAEYTIPTASSGPEIITAGPDGALWFTELTGNKIGRITTAGGITENAVPTANAGPLGIAAGPDHALWFAEGAGSNQIGRLGLPTYTLTVTALPSGSGTVSGGGTFAAVSSQTVTATPHGGRSFLSWTMNGNVVSRSPSYTFTLTGNFPTGRQFHRLCRARRQRRRQKRPSLARHLRRHHPVVHGRRRRYSGR